MQTQTAFAVAHVEAVAEELQLANVGTLGLLAVDPQLQVTLYELGDAVPYTLHRTTAPTEYKAVVGIAHKGVAASLQLLVKLIQQDVGKQRTQRAALRSALTGRLHLRANHHACVEVAVDERDNCIVLDCPLQYLYQLRVVHRVEEAFKVDANRVAVALIKLIQQGYSLAGDSVRRLRRRRGH